MNTDQTTPQILGSWKEIAQYLGKGVRTVQRWELVHGLPVRRPSGAARGVVYASREEIERWLATNWSPRMAKPSSDGSNILYSSDGRTTSELLRQSANLRHETHDLVTLVSQRVVALRKQCELMAVLTTQSAETRRAVRGDAA